MLQISFIMDSISSANRPESNATRRPELLKRRLERKSASLNMFGQRLSSTKTDRGTRKYLETSLIEIVIFCVKLFQ